jgi:hypothetical protein
MMFGPAEMSATVMDEPETVMGTEKVSPVPAAVMGMEGVTAAAVIMGLTLTSLTLFNNQILGKNNVSKIWRKKIKIKYIKLVLTKNHAITVPFPVEGDAEICSDNKSEEAFAKDVGSRQRRPLLHC